jgi:hypothetical protein
VYLLACILRKHLPSIGYKQCSQDLGPVLLLRLWFLPGGFPKIGNKPKLDELIFREVALGGSQGQAFFSQVGITILQNRKAILETLGGLLDCMGHSISKLAHGHGDELVILHHDHP